MGANRTRKVQPRRTSRALPVLPGSRIQTSQPDHPRRRGPVAGPPPASPGSRAEVKLSLGPRYRPGLLLHSRHGLRSTFVALDENVGISAVACVVVVA